jgi:predicted nucleic acid-binding protein
MRLYLDASTIIYAIESLPPFRDTVIAWIMQAEGIVGGIVITSRLSRLECRVKPLREANAELLAKYDEFFTRKLVSVAEITAPVIERATDLRVRYGLRTPDAVHLATAIEEHAAVFLTGDTALARCTEVRVEVLRPR